MALWRVSLATGYQLFVEAKDMPAEYHQLLIRQSIEQARLLNWGDKVGLEQERIKNPSRTLQQNANLIIDVMLEMQATFRDTVKIQETYNPYLTQPNPPTAVRSDEADQHFTRGASTMLEKTLKFFEKVPQTKNRLTWAMVKKDKFERLIEKLIGHNTYIEGLLDDVAMEQLAFMQQKTYMAMLQLNSNVAELKEISLAMQIRTFTPAKSSDFTRDSHRSSETSQHEGSRTSFARLAEFKAKQISLDDKPLDIEPIETSEVNVKDSDDETRSEAVYQSRRVWIEWKNYDLYHNPRSDWNRTIENRIKKLAILLSSDRKPEQFGAPHCLGYFNDEAEERYGFLYQKPIEVSSE